MIMTEHRKLAVLATRPTGMFFQSMLISSSKSLPSGNPAARDCTWQTMVVAVQAGAGMDRPQILSAGGTRPR